MSHVLHYAPDNASLIIRLALDTIGLAYSTVLVDRSKREQCSASYRKLNPNGLIPTFETPDGTLFETGAILLWLVDTHGVIGPKAGDEGRAAFLKWLFFCANTVHPHMQLLFYPDKLVGDDPGLKQSVTDGARRALMRDFAILEQAANQAFGDDTPTAIDFYVACLLRWCAIYGPDNRDWFTLAHSPRLSHICKRADAWPATEIAIRAEGLGPAPFTAPQRPNPPEGSAL
ncbi:glutathione S-transferase [Tateyamaria omphalii]|uniref:glutathione S-transferase family protein n=1 Tax=Tateyamaria omphalii TaxID=299262 RepID=UPI001678AA70|nr:glutathione S-transferase family protein [Tateyamaria omphalii]GGX54677.1 glutathione S-transferase [Tateyamaria omphalii]